MQSMKKTTPAPHLRAVDCLEEPRTASAERKRFTKMNLEITSEGVWYFKTYKCMQTLDQSLKPQQYSNDWEYAQAE